MDKHDNTTPPYDAVYDIYEPQAQSGAPLWVVSSPHSGTLYPASFIAVARLNKHELRRSEDAYIDTLLTDLPNQGAVVVAARLARAYLDLNREPYELDPAMFKDKLPAYVNSRSPRVRAGLGTIARLVGEQLPIYRAKLSFDEAEARIDTVYKPFHNKLKSLLDEAHATHGTAFLLDIHSMPSTLPAAQSAPQPAHTPPAQTPSAQTKDKADSMPDIILGDRHGTSCHPALTQSVKAYFTACGYRTICNKFYTGGYITAHYGQPSQQRHALQIEIARRLYMNEKTYAPLDTLAQLKADLSGLLKHLRSEETALLATINAHATQTRPAAE